MWSDYGVMIGSCTHSTSVKALLMAYKDAIGKQLIGLLYNIG